MASTTREQVLAAYRNNPKAPLVPDENAIQYWMTNGLENFNAIVDQVRAENPGLASQIDSERAAQAESTRLAAIDDAYRLMYQEVTGSNPDSGGLSYWKQQFGDQIDAQEKEIFKRTALELTAQQAFGRQLSNAEKAELFNLGTVQQANDWAAQKGLDWTNLQQQKLDAAQKAFGRQLSDAEKAEVASLGSVQQVNDWAAQKGQEWLSAQQAASAAQAGGAANVGIIALDRFYDPVLKNTWVIESANDYETIDTFNKPKGGERLVYINPQTGEALNREAYLQVANTPEAVNYRAEQERIAAENAKLFRPGNTLDNPLAGITDFGGMSVIGALTTNNQVLTDALGHASTFIKTYKVVDGQMQEVPDSQVTPQDVASGNVLFYIGGATGGPNRQRMAQVYRPQGDKLIPVGEPSFYQGAHPDQAIMDFAKVVLPLALMAFPGVGQAVGAALGATGTTATALGNAIINAGVSVASGVPIDTAIKNAAASFGVSQFVPNLTGNTYIDNAVKSVSTAALTGGDLQNALANSLISTGASQNLGGVSITGDLVADSAIVSGVTGALQAAATGGDVGQSALQGFASGAISAANKPVTPVIPGTSTTISGSAATDTLTPGVTTGGLGSTVDVGMDTTPSVTQDDVLGIVAQEQAANQAQSTNQAMQGAKQITTAEAQARELYPLTERYLGPNGTVYLRDINTGKITQVLPQGDVSQVTGGGVYLDAPKVIGAIESLPASAVYQGILYANDPKLIGKQLTADDLSSLSMSSGRDANVLPVGNLVVTQNADGTVTQRDKVTGDTATIDANGNIVSQTKSAYTKVNEVAGGLTGTAQAGLGELGAALSATAQQLGVDSQAAIDRFKAIQSSGELMRPEYVNQQSQAFVNEIYRVASDPNSTSGQIAKAIASAALNNPAGAAAILGSELIQELPSLLLPGGKVAQFLGSMALNAAESAGAQALQKIDELKAANPNATPQELARMARQDAGVAGAVTAAIGLIPGANNVIARTLLEPVTEALEEGLIEYITTGDANAAKGKAVLGAVIGGKTAAAINTGEELATAVQNNFGVQVPGGVAATPGASITVTAPSLPADTTVDPGVDLTPDNLGTLSTTGVDIPTFDVAADTGADQSAGVVVAVNPNSNQASVIDNTGTLSIVPANGLTPGQTTVLPTAPTVTTPTAPVVTETAPAVTTTPTVTTTPAATTPVVTDTSGVVTTAPSVTTGVVLQDNGDGTSLVLTQDGGATNVPSVDVTTGNTLAPGASVTVNPDTNTATVTSPEMVAQPEVTPEVTPTPEVVTQPEPEVVTESEVVTEPEPEVTAPPEVTPEPTPQINTEEPEPTQPEDLISPPPELTVTEPTPEDRLLQQIIKELEKPTVPETPEPAPIEPPPFTPPESVVETPPVTVEQRLTVSPRTVRPTVMPGSRVEETAQILPIRPGLSEGGTGGIEGTPEEEQQPVWNVRSLKLRRLLGI